MTRVDAVYQGGVFRPLGDVGLEENQEVSLFVEPVPGRDALKWLEQARELQRQIMQERGVLPDSTPDIAADRSRQSHAHDTVATLSYD